MKYHRKKVNIVQCCKLKIAETCRQSPKKVLHFFDLSRFCSNHGEINYIMSVDCINKPFHSFTNLIFNFYFRKYHVARRPGWMIIFLT